MEQARKALRALKGLVKLQALVRGYMVRKQAAATLRSMEAMVRAQSSVTAHKVHMNKLHSKERFDESRSEYPSFHSRRLSSSFETSLIDESPKIVEMDPGRPKSRSRRTNTWASTPGYSDNPNPQTFSSPARHQSPARLPIPSSQSHDMEAMVRAQSSVTAHKVHMNKLHSKERFDESRSEYPSFHSRRLSSSFETSLIDESPKIVEMDPGRPKSRSRRTNTWASTPGYSDNPNPQTFSSPARHQSPARLPIPSSQSHEFEWAPHLKPYHGRPVSPSKSVCTDGSSSNRSYMATTKSFNAKLRSHSAPRQRPEFGYGYKKKMSLNEMMESRNSVSYGVKMKRSSSQAQDQEATSFKSAVMDRLGGFSNIQW
ncbi:hypothetical protein CTI12_AA310030 [Artemisia annua]|uniref:DUF4005 domain-containing protein n=1 Tax=Artemisia annua TaxID=35608 RepID=A0A2U1N3L9_ARTAN|nr:hypothetical protein CTI12_AA310030 [Artemisia annua]